MFCCERAKKAADLAEPAEILAQREAEARIFGSQSPGRYPTTPEKPWEASIGSQIKRYSASPRDSQLVSENNVSMRAALRDEVNLLLPEIQKSLVDAVAAGKNSNSNELAALQSQGSGNMFEVTLERDHGNKWGMDVDYATARGLKVVLIKDDGIIKGYNDKHPERMVSPEDWIVAVNDTQNDSVRMAMHLADSRLNSLKLVVRKASSCSVETG